MSRKENLPVPVWRGFAVGVAEPVSMNWPGSSERSTAKRTASQSWGASCHSSMSRGFNPLNSREGFVSAIAMLLARSSGSCMNTVLFARCKAVAVFPHHFGPRMTTAPAYESLSASSSSTTRGRYAATTISLQRFQPTVCNDFNPLFATISTHCLQFASGPAGAYGFAEGSYPRTSAPVAALTFFTRRSWALSTSSLVSVRSAARYVRAKAIDFLPAPTRSSSR